MELGPAAPLILLLLAVTAAGCLTTLDPDSAQERLTLARQVAERWSPNATLAGLLGTEGPLTPQAPQGQEDAVPTVPTDTVPTGDDDVGDGEGLLWVYGFVAPEKDGVLAVASGLAVGGVRAGQHDGLDLPAMGEWRLDSTDAAEAARNANTSFRNASQAPGARLYYELHDPQDEPPRWRIHASPDPEEAGWTATVDAQDGDVTVQEGLPDWGWEDPRDPPHPAGSPRPAG